MGAGLGALLGALLLLMLLLPPAFIVGGKGNGVEGGGTKVPPIENVAPREEEGYGEDPHSYPRWDPDAQQQMSDWMRPGAQGTDRAAIDETRCGRAAASR